MTENRQKYSRFKILQMRSSRKTENKRKSKEINEEIGQRNFPELDSNFQMERAQFTKYPVQLIILNK